MNMKLQKLGTLLQLPTFHHFYNIPVRSFLGSLSLFIIVFSKDNQTYFIDLDSENGLTKESRFASHFSEETIFVGLGAIPFENLASCQLLAIPHQRSKKGISTSDLLIHYSKLPVFKQIAEQQRLREQSSLYDPYRYSYTRLEKEDKEEKHLNLVPRKEYEKIRDFHPFLKTNRGNVYAVPCQYTDEKRGQTTKIYLMGWYFYEKQLKVSWKPSHSRKSRWRSSIIFVDKLSDRYFFQGQLYKKGTFPIFLDHLAPSISGRPSLDKEFQALLTIIEEQKRRAKLRYK
ncbi:TPA: hypothetical protein ACGO2X_000872 [Streptococcus suis]